MAKHVKLPKRVWRRDRPQVRATSSYTKSMYERAFGHKYELNVMKRQWKYDSTIECFLCYKCNATVMPDDIRCLNCQAEVDRGE